MTARAGRRPLALGVLAAAAVVAAVGVGAVLTRGEGFFAGTGTGSFDGSIAAGSAGAHRLSIPAGTVAVVQVSPDDDLDAMVGFAVPGADADRIESVYGATAFAGDATPRSVGDALDGLDRRAVDGLPAGARVVFRRDVGFAGGPETTFLAVPFDVDATVVVAGFDGSAGDYRIDIEVVALAGLDGDAGGQDLLDAVAAADVPSAVVDDITTRAADD